jgi:hypothetical protein
MVEIATGEADDMAEKFHFPRSLVCVDHASSLAIVQRLTL